MATRTDYRIGLSTWTDKALPEDGNFYPRKTMTAQERIWWYRHFFDMVEIPAQEVTKAWVDWTDPGCLVNVRAPALLEGREVDVARLPNAVRVSLPPAVRKQGRARPEALGDDARSWAFVELRRALARLEKADRLGSVLFEMASWIERTAEALDHLAALRAELPDATIAVELRHRSWFGEHTDDTLRFLARHRLTYVSADGPRDGGTPPLLPVVTSPTAVFRLHGRNSSGYLYSHEELAEIARAAASLHGHVERVHVALDNERGDYSMINALELKEMLVEGWRAPDRHVLVEELEARRARSKGRTRRPGVA